jgi:Lrp/AsnC family transcriptional regulator, leucine-responsive regulatory protein
MNQLDKTDKQILKILQNNGRITNKELSSQLGLSPPPTLERVKKLESMGYIQGYEARLDPQKIELNTIMMVSVALHQHTHETISEFRQAIQDLEEVMECYHVTGDNDYLLKVVCNSISDYESFIVEKLSVLKNLGKIKSSVVLSTVKKSNQYPISL